MIDLRHIRHPLAVASNSTVQAAADALHLTQPALTNCIARFEDELGAKLFDRRGRRLVLTELGERLVSRGCRSAFAQGGGRFLRRPIGSWRCSRVDAYWDETSAL